jgi:site-specific DNA-methyltransferase (adenine-specific)
MEMIENIPRETNLNLNQVTHGDALGLLRDTPSGLIQTIITSPPYYGHRKYQTDSLLEVGRENSVRLYVSRLVDIFHEAKRVLSDSGTLWLNIGDSYEDSHLLGVPWRVAFALQDDGWTLRSDIIWHKPNAMPSAVRSRPTTDHEYIFLFSKSKKYYYDSDAIREPHLTFSENSKMRGGRKHLKEGGSTPEKGKFQGYQSLHSGNWDRAFHPLGRNRRTVWSIPLSKFRGAHFAVFPEQLITPCVLAGSRTGEIVLDPFAGSGTTGVVAIKQGREFVGFDLSQEYVALANQRLCGLY